MQYNTELFILDDTNIPSNQHTVKMGEHYNYLTVISDPFWLKRKKLVKDKYQQKIQYVECRCVCNKVKTFQAFKVKQNKIKSCGCKSKESFQKKRQKGSYLENGYKKCSRCLRVLNYDCFHKSNYSKDKLRGECVDCKYFEYIRRKFKITQNQIDTILTNSNLRCEICDKQLLLPSQNQNRKTKKQSFVFDHCHINGNIRGILCHGCNFCLGHIEDNPNLLNNIQNFKTYLDKKRY